MISRWGARFLYLAETLVIRRLSNFAVLGRVRSFVIDVDESTIDLRQLLEFVLESLRAVNGVKGSQIQRDSRQQL